MQIKIIRTYPDRQLNRAVLLDEVFSIPQDIAEERAQQLIAAGYAEESTEYGYKPRKSKHTFEEDIDG